MRINDRGFDPDVALITSHLTLNSQLPLSQKYEVMLPVCEPLTSNHFSTMVTTIERTMFEHHYELFEAAEYLKKRELFLQLFLEDWLEKFPIVDYGLKSNRERYRIETGFNEVS